jgi:hypothetical protein
MRNEMNSNDHQKAYRACTIMIDREGEPGQQWENDARPPFRAFAMSADDAVNQRVSDFVLDLSISHCRPVPS